MSCTCHAKKRPSRPQNAPEVPRLPKMYIAQKLEHGALVKWDFLVRATIKFAGHASLESKQHLNHYRKNPYCDQRLFGEKLDDHIMICQNAFLVVDLVVADFIEGNFGGAGVRQSIGSWSRGSERGDILAHWGAHGGGVETLVGGFSRLKILPGMVILTFDIFRFQHVETTSRKQLYHLHPWSTVRTVKFEGWTQFINIYNCCVQLGRCARFKAANLASTPWTKVDARQHVPCVMYTTRWRRDGHANSCGTATKTWSNALWSWRCVNNNWEFAATGNAFACFRMFSHVQR